MNETPRAGHVLATRARTRQRHRRYLALVSTMFVMAAVVLAACGSTSGSTSSHNATKPGSTVYRWGVVGNKGAITQLQLETPTAIAGISGKVVQIATSNSDGYALTSTGAVYGWGVNSDGELGDGGLTPYETSAVKVDFPAGVTITSLANPMPFDAGLAIDSNGHAWGWGLNGADDLCLSGLVKAHPQQLPLSDVTLATGARTHALFDSKGNLFACGSGDAGELGNGSTASANTPTPVVGLPSGVKITALTSSWEGSGALLANGDYYNWGYNAAGQLGNGSTANSAVPVKVDLPGLRKAGLPGRERAEERTDRRHPAGREHLGLGGQRSRTARHRHPDKLRRPSEGPRPSGRHLRHGELGWLRQLRHRPDRAALGVGRQRQWATWDRFAPTAHNPSGGRRHPSHPGVVHGTERCRTRGPHLNGSLPGVARRAVPPS